MAADGAVVDSLATMRRPRPILSPLLVGRDDLLALAERRIAEAAGGHGGLILLAGEAGVGKTRLLRAISQRAREERFKLSEGALAPQDRQVPLASVGDLARSVRDNPEFGTLGADLLALRHDGGADNLGSRRVLILHVVDLIAAAIDRPTLLMFEDLQWADELSLEVVGELAKLARHKPLLVVGTYRIDEIRAGDSSREWRARLLSQRQAEEVRLGPLTKEQTALVTTLILDTGLPAPRDVVAAVFERSNGIPLHIEELLAALGEEGPVDAAAVRSAHVPDTIEDAVLARYARLTESAKTVARAAAVIGRCFIPEVVAGCLDRPLQELDAPLGELVDQSFLYPFDFLDHGFYDFRHQLLRDALYGVIPPSELRRLHARAGEFGGLIEGASEIHASVHFERAGLRPQAYRAALVGAKAASAVSSRREAFELYGRAVANLPDDISPEERADLYEAYCDAAFAIDDVPAIEETARLAREHNLAAGRRLEAAANLVSLAGMARRDVRPVAERRALLERADQELAALPESAERFQVLSDVRLMRGILERDALRLDEAVTEFDEARRLWLASGDPDTSDIDYMAAEYDIVSGRVDEGLGTMLRIAREARELRREATGVTAFRWAAAMAVRVMDYPRAAIGLREGLEYADQIEQSYCRHVLAATSAHLDWTAGRWDEAVATASLELVEKGSRRGTLSSRDVLGLVALGRGETARAEELFESTLAISRASEEVDLILPALWGLAETALLARDPQRAIERCDEAWALVERTGERALLIPFVVTGARAHLAARRPDAAADWLERMRAHLRDWMWLAGRAVDHADGLVRMATGSTGLARDLLESAVRGWDERGRIWEATWARIDLARCDLRVNRPGEASMLLAEAETTATLLGSPPLRVAIAEVRRQLKGRLVEDEPWAPLTSREFEVARQVAVGSTNAEIAAALDIAPKTASAHIEHILAKLGMSRRAEIAAWASRVDGTAQRAPGREPAGVARR
jgi:DNA-binding CsgD family transcriptional regulator